jgi:hypothetical protein
MRAACDAFFARRGLNIYGGTQPLVRGMAAVVQRAAVNGQAKQQKKVKRAAVDTPRPA